MPPRRLSAFERDAMAQAAARRGRARCRRPAVQDPPGPRHRDSALLRSASAPVADGEAFRGAHHRRARRRRPRRPRRRAPAAADAIPRAGVPQLRAARRRERSAGRAPPARNSCWPRRAPRRVGHVIVTVPDWIADPAGLFVADFDLLNRLPNLAAIDIVSTEGALASGFHERLHNWWPGIEEIAVRRSAAAGSADQADARRAGADSRCLSALVHAPRSRRRADRDCPAARGEPDRLARCRCGRVQASAPVSVSGCGHAGRGRHPVRACRTRCRWRPNRRSRRSTSCSMPSSRTSAATASIALLRSPHLDAAPRLSPRVDRRARPGAQRRSISRWCSPAVRHRRFVAGRPRGARTPWSSVRVAAMPALAVAIVIVRELTELQQSRTGIGAARRAWTPFWSGTCRRSIRHTICSTASAGPARRFSRSCSSWRRPTRHTTILRGASPTSRQSVRRWIGDADVRA